MAGFSFNPSELGDDSDEPSEALISEINITPLTDVFLVLLIIFMVTSSAFSQMGMEVDLPGSQSAESLGQPSGVILTLKASGETLLNGKPLNLNTKKKALDLLRSQLETTKDRMVVIEGDQNAILGKAIELMDFSREAGAQGFAIATEPKS